MRSRSFYDQGMHKAAVGVFPGQIAQECFSILGVIFAASANDAIMLDLLLLGCVIADSAAISVQNPCVKEFAFGITVVVADFDFHSWKGLLTEIAVMH